MRAVTRAGLEPATYGLKVENGGLADSRRRKHLGVLPSQQKPEKPINGDPPCDRLSQRSATNSATSVGARLVERLSSGWWVWE
jgi:hypothetical protein